MVKQYLEKKWDRGISKDPFVGYKGQFQYGRNVNIRDMANGFALSSELENSHTSEVVQTARYIYVGYDHSRLVKVLCGGPKWVLLQNNDQRPTTSSYIGELDGATPDFVLKFQENIRVFGSDIFVFDATLGQGVLSPISDPTYTDPFSGVTHTFSSASSVLNYANSMILVGDGNKLWRYVPVATPDLPIGWKVIREFEEGTDIKGLTMEGNYLKMYVVNNNLDTKIHYAKGTFDVEDTGLVQTVNFDRLYLESVASDGILDYALFRNSADSTEYILYEINGYNKTEIKRTRLPGDGGDMTTFLGHPGNNMDIKDGLLICPMADGIRTFKKTDGIWSGILERTDSYFLGNYFPDNCYIYGDYVYLSCQYQFGGEHRELRANLEWISATYQPEGFLIGRIYDGGEISVGKTNLQMTIGYLLSSDSSSPGSIEVEIRRDREGTGFGSFYLIKTIDDAEKMYAEIFPSSNENFRKNWNVLEYYITLKRGIDKTVTPRFYELNLIYDLIRRIKK